MENNNNKKTIIKTAALWLFLFLIVFITFKFHFNKKITTSVVILYGLLTPIFHSALALLGVWIAAIPWVGPLLIKIILLPITWIVNGIAYILSIIFMAKGETKKTIDARILSIVLFIGLILGYIFGKIF